MPAIALAMRYALMRGTANNIYCEVSYVDRNEIFDTNEEQKYLTQKELAKRWRVAESTIKNLRDKGYLTYFQFPGSTRVLYPVEQVMAAEEEYTTCRKEGGKGKLTFGIKKGKPVVSTNKVWRI